MFVPQSYDWGQEGQVDWFEAVAKLGGESRKLQFFAMRSMASGDAFHRAYTNATQQALLEAHEHAFDYFGGVFRTLRYDNMTSLVKKILRGRQRIETDRIIAFRSHWGYQSEYCNPASGHEKGGVEGELGWYRRNCLVPVPEAENVAALNEQLLAACVANRERTISGKSMTVGQASEYERAFLLPLAEEGFPLEEVLYPLLVDGKGRVRVKTNWYSAPLSAGCARGGGGRAVVGRDQARPPVRGATPALLRTRPSDPGSGALPGCAGEEAGSDGRFHAAASNGGRRGAGPSAWTGSGGSLSNVTAAAPERER